MEDQDYIRAREFDKTMESLNEKIDSGFKSVHSRFDTLEPEVMDHAKKIAVLEYQASQAWKAANVASAEVRTTRTKTRNSAAVWGSGTAAFVWGAIELIKAVKTLVTGH